MSGASEQARTKVRPVQDVVNHAADIHSPSSAHKGILPHPPDEKRFLTLFPRPLATVIGAHYISVSKLQNQADRLGVRRA